MLFLFPTILLLLATYSEQNVYPVMYRNEITGRIRKNKEAAEKAKLLKKSMLQHVTI